MSEVNYELLHKVLQSVRNHPEHHDQSSWVGVVAPTPGEASKFTFSSVRIGMSDLIVAEGSCETSACLAGWTLLHSSFVARDGRSFDTQVRFDAFSAPSGDSVSFESVGEEAASLLGISNMRWGQVFFDYVNNRAIAQMMFLYVRGHLPEPVVTEVDEETGETSDPDLSEWEDEVIMDSEYLLLDGMDHEQFAREWYERFLDFFVPEKEVVGSRG